MSNIKVFENDLPKDLDLSNEKFIGLDNEALGLVLGRPPNSCSIRTGVKKFLFNKTQ